MHPDTRVAYITRFVPAYRVPILERLNDALNDRLTVVSGHPPGDSSFGSLTRPVETGYEQLRARNLWLGGERLHWQQLGGVWSRLPSRTLVILEESPRTVSLPLTLSACRKRDWPVLLWGHFVSRHRGSQQTSMRDRYRMWLASRADGLITYSEGLRSELSAIPGLPPVFAAPNTLESDSLIQARKQLENEDRTSLRQRLGLDASKPCLLFIGRLIAEKGVHAFLEVVEQAGQTRDGGVQAIMIGDGPERNDLESRSRASGLAVHFTGTIADPAEAAPWIVASDLLLNPGYVGLSLNHAMLLGTPVVAPRPASGSRFHSPEWDFLEDGLNGTVAGSAAVLDLVAAVDRTLDRGQEMGRETAVWADEHLSSDRMIEGLMAAIHHAAGMEKAHA